MLSSAAIGKLTIGLFVSPGISMAKFLCIKGVIFFMWWQGVGIGVLKSYHVIDDKGSWAAEDVADGLQDYLICIEMLGFAIAHMYTYSYIGELKP